MNCSCSWTRARLVSVGELEGLEICTCISQTSLLNYAQQGFWMKDLMHLK